jgi:mannose-6-phosphate isomerase-like protein (cupin superfamily)
MKRILGLAALAIFSVGVTAAVAADVVYLSKDKVDAARMKPGMMTSGDDHVVIMSRRNKGGKAEIHAEQTDVFYIVEGSATFVTGGAVVGAKDTGPGQKLGDSITGGTTHNLSVGDVIVIPKGTPHWFKEVPDLVVYYVVKAVTPGAK